MGSYSDAQKVSKLSKKMDKAVSNNEICLSVEQDLNSGTKKIIATLSEALVDGFSNYEPDPNIPTLLRCVITHSKNDFYHQNFFILNPEGYMPPDDITQTEIEGLLALIEADISEVLSTIEGDPSNYRTNLEAFSVYQS